MHASYPMIDNMPALLIRAEADGVLERIIQNGLSDAAAEARHPLQQRRRFLRLP